MTDNIIGTKLASVTGIAVPTGGLFPAGVLNAEGLQKLNYCIENGLIFHLGVMGEEEGVTGAYFCSGADYSLMYNGGAGSVWGSDALSTWYDSDGGWSDGGEDRFIGYNGSGQDRRFWAGFPTSGLGFPPITYAEIWINRAPGWEGQNTHIHFVVTAADPNLDPFTAFALMGETTPANTAPTCSIVQDSISHGLVYVTPTASDTEGTISSLVITWGDGTTTADCVSGTSYSHLFLTGGEKNIYATATDDGALSTESNHLTPTVTLNVAPTCSFTVNSVVNRTVTATVTGTDSDGTIASSVITWGDLVTTTLSAGERTTLQGGGSVQKTHTYTTAGGSFSAYATHIDDDGATTSSDTTQVVISANTAPVCSGTVLIDSSDHLTATINANASTDEDGTIASWRYQPDTGADWVAGVVGEALVYVYPAHSDELAAYTIEVTDNEGATNTAQGVADIGNDAPSVALEADAIYHSVVFTVTYDDSDGSVASALLDYGDGTEPVSVNNGVQNAYIYETAGTMTAALTVTDDDGASSTASIEVVVADEPVEEPTTPTTWSHIAHVLAVQPSAKNIIWLLINSPTMWYNTYGALTCAYFAVVFNTSGNHRR